MHRRERLKRTRACVRAYGIARSQMSPATLPLLPAVLLPTRILQGFRMFAGFFLADQMFHPAIERLGRQPVLAAIIRARHSALTPCLDVQRPIRAVRFYPGPRCHRRSSHVRENQIWNDTALSESRARFGRLRRKSGHGNIDANDPPQTSASGGAEQVSSTEGSQATRRPGLCLIDLTS